MDELTYLPAVSLAEHIREKKLSPVELAEAHLLRVGELNSKLNAFVQIDADGARRQARAAETTVMRGEKLGPLHGVPVSIKSSVAVRGMRHEAGTKLRVGLVAEKDAILVERLRAAGAIILGTTNSPELLMAWETDNLLYGRTNNPWDLSRTAGGSSGGEAAAIASGCSAAGVGSDGGGSIRVPAHFSGICGLKPTPGRIPSTGHFPTSVGPFAFLGVVGPMARTIGDLKVLFEVMQGWDDGDTSAAPVPVRWPENIKNARVAYFEDDGHTPVTAETRDAVQQAADLLQKAGITVERFLPEGLEQAQRLWWQFFGVAGAMLLGPLTNGREADLSPIFREFQSWTGAETPHTAQTLLDTWILRDALRIQLFEQIRNYSALLCPVAAIPAFRHGERSWNMEGKMVRYLDAWSYCEWFNLLGMPAAVVPVGQSQDGLPIGVQIVGRPREEEIVLTVAAELERQRGAWKRPPID